MRLVAASIAILLFCGSAQASSFVAVAPPKPGTSGSFMHLGNASVPDPELPKPVQSAAISSIYVAPLPAGFHTVSPSIIAMDMAVPVTPQYMASAVEQPKPRRRHAPILVIRGGVIGGAAPEPGATQVAAEETEAPQQAVTAPTVPPSRQPYFPPHMPEPAPPPPLPAGAYGRPQ